MLSHIPGLYRSVSASYILLPPEEELPPEPEEGVLIYAALNPVTTYLKTSIKTYNKTHPEMQIEIRDCSDDVGPERLMTELMLGEVPDIMEMQERETIYI